MTWPATRLRTYVDGVTELSAADLNEIQDQLMIARRRGRTTLIIGAPDAKPKEHPVTFDAGMWSQDSAGDFAKYTGDLTNSAVLAVPCRLKRGDTLYGFSVVWRDSVGTAFPLVAKLIGYRAIHGGTASIFFAGTDLPNDAVTTVDKQSQELATPIVLGADESYVLHILASSTASTKHFIRAEFDVARGTG
jgi:hypothetical protein